MKNILYALAILQLCFVAGSLSAQSIARSTLCSAGATYVTPNGMVSSTFGQCPGCGSMITSNGIVNPGFQQPLDNDTCFNVAIEFFTNLDPCGTSYDFMYTGEADIDLAEFYWDFGATGFPQTANGPDANGISFSDTGTVSITLTVVEDDCEKTGTFMVEAEAGGFAVNPVIQNLVCPDDADGSITLEIIGGVEPYLITWSTGGSSETISGLEAGDYSYTVSDASSCEVSNTVQIDVPIGGLAVDVIVTNETCEGDLDGGIVVEITGGAEPYDISWSTGENTADLASLAGGVYTVTVTDADGCEVVREISVGQTCNPEVPDVFSPNGDGVNDEWVIPELVNFPNNEVRIFNRWGEVIFQQKAYANDWQGTYTNGQLLNIGAYYYIIKLNDPNDTVLSGSITIVR